MVRLKSSGDSEGFSVVGFILEFILRYKRTVVEENDV